MIILASASPRRKELMGLITPEFRVCPANIDESVPSDVPLTERPVLIAGKKAEAVAVNPALAGEGDIVIGCDTGVFIDGKMLGKPKNAEDAENMLSLLSGRVHSVITGCCIDDGDLCKLFSCVTMVEFYKLSPAEIKEYVSTGEPFDKAGAYGIQGRGSLLVKGIRGDYFNVVGLPVSELNRKLKRDFDYGKH